VTDDQARAVLARSSGARRSGGPTRPRTRRSGCCCAASPGCSRTSRRAVPVAALPGQRRWRCGGGHRGEGPAEAILAVEVGGVRRLGAGEGNGPVDALDHAFRNAVNGTWPHLDRVHLADYKVRILEAGGPRRGAEGIGTDAVTRVLVTSTDGTTKWDTVGVHANVVEASWLALSDAYTHAILRVGW
jgi:hypothetical protein